MGTRSRDDDMPGETNLDYLLRNAEPEVVPGEYVFVSVGEKKIERLLKHASLVFREKEGVTAILPKSFADDESLEYESIWGLISMNVHSDLETIGFLAEITKLLRNAGISVNVVSAYYHDHLFVPFDRVQDALRVLNELSTSKER